MKSLKRCLCVVIVAAMLCIGAPAALAGFGDVNEDGVITASDARIVLRAAASLITISSETVLKADINGDGKITSADARILLRISAGLDSAQNYLPDFGPEDNAPLTVKLEESTDVASCSPTDIYLTATTFTLEVHAYSQSGSEFSRGSGFFITDDGMAVTNYHVIEDAYFVKVSDYRGNVFNVLSVLGYSKSKDVAILMTDAFQSINAVKSAKIPIPGDSAYVLGSPRGYTGTFTDGMISAVDRVIETTGNGIGYIQLTAPMSNGTSGGPVLDSTGCVIGIATMSNTDGQNLNFALPISVVETIDISKPMTVAAVYDKEHGGAANDFTGAIALSNDGISLKNGGTAIIYAVAAASSEYTLTASSDNELVDVFIGQTYGNMTVIYICSSASSGTARIKIGFEQSCEYSKTLFVTLGGAASDGYAGLSKLIPDFGAMLQVVPYSCSEELYDGKSCHLIKYSVDSLPGDAVKLTEEYVRFAELRGFERAQSQSDSIIRMTSEDASLIIGRGTDEQYGECIFIVVFK